MAGLKDHPIAERIRLNPPAPPASLSLDALKALVMECGADDCGIVSLDDPLLKDEAVHARRAFAGARLAVSIVSRMNRAPIRSPARSASNNEFHKVSHDVDDIARELVRRLGRHGNLGDESSDGIPHGIRQVPGTGMGGLAQARCRSRRRWKARHPS